jgi:asparagine synthase (glutamine-hydrolysing)
VCGIVGAVSFNHYEISPELIIKMRDTMVHRGPDGAGVWVNQEKNVGLGHRRLSIIDLSDTASQPMLSQSQRYVLTFNGEIYNHAEIRKKLIYLGHTDWKSNHSDTEVLLKAFEYWGIECVHQFRGMFAFAVWDAQDKKLWLVRDRIGVKPLYYSFHHGRITFASEIKALLKDPDQVRSMNNEAFFHYLTFITTPAPMTMFSGIEKLEPGTWLCVNEQGDIKKEKYWDVWSYTKPLKNKSENEIADLVLEELKESVRLRKESDVPVGVFLSGGIDSSTNTALFSHKSLAKVSTFSIGYEGEYETYQNELHYAKMMANEVGANYYERFLTQSDLLSFLPEMIWHQDEPIGDPVCFPVYYVSKLARDNGIIVCQVGEGSDELFYGYESWKSYLRLQKWASFPGSVWVQKIILKGAQSLRKDSFFEAELLRRSCSRKPIFWGSAQGFGEVAKRHLLSESLNQTFKYKTSWDAIEGIWNCYQENAWERSSLNWMSYLDLSFRLPELLLMRVDKMSMGVSLEARVPFLDHKFVELAMSIPSRLKTKSGVLKSILKKSVRGVIPDEIIDRKKQGFGVPIYEWLSDRLGEEIKNELAFFCKESDCLNPKAVEEYARRGFDCNVWYLFNVAMWWRSYIYNQ